MLTLLAYLTLSSTAIAAAQNNVIKSKSSEVKLPGSNLSVAT